MRSRNLAKRFENKEIQRTWSVKTKVISGIVWTTETVSQSSIKYLSNTTGKHNMKELVNINFMALCTYFGKYRCKVQNIYHGK
jgi:hypothetical protein